MSESQRVRAAKMLAGRITGPEAIVAMELMLEFEEVENQALREALEAIIKEMANCGSDGATHAMNDCGCQMAMSLANKALEDK